MKNVTVENRATVIIILLVVAVLIEFIGIAPGFEYISGAFPTYYHKAESIVLVTVMFASLGFVAFGNGFFKKIAIIIIGALMFYAVSKAVLSMISLNQLHAKLIWTGVSLIMFSMLAWIINAAFREKYFGWKDLFYSLLIANFGFIYLRYISFAG